MPNPATRSATPHVKPAAHPRNEALLRAMEDLFAARAAQEKAQQTFFAALQSQETENHVKAVFPGTYSRVQKIQASHAGGSLPMTMAIVSILAAKGSMSGKDLAFLVKHFTGKPWEYGGSMSTLEFFDLFARDRAFIFDNAYRLAEGNAAP